MSIGQEHYASAPVGRFAPAVVAVRAAAERRQKSGLAVYRDNVIVALVNALAARYPVVRRMAGDESFRAAAHRFVMAESPRSLVLPLVFIPNSSFAGRLEWMTLNWQHRFLCH